METRKVFVQNIRQALNDSDDVEDSEDMVKEMDSHAYHENDEDLMQYAKQYKAKVGYH